MPRKLNKQHLLSELRRLLARPDTRVIQRKLKICGHSTWEYWENADGTKDHTRIQNITIYVDPRRDGRVRLAIHELLHVYMNGYLLLGDRMVYELEEAAILAWESCLYSWLHDPKRADALESWSKAIERKVR